MCRNDASHLSCLHLTEDASLSLTQVLQLARNPNVPGFSPFLCSVSLAGRTSLHILSGLPLTQGVTILRDGLMFWLERVFRWMILMLRTLTNAFEFPVFVAWKLVQVMMMIGNYQMF